MNLITRDENNENNKNNENNDTNINFNIDTLKYLGNMHIQLMSELKEKINIFKTNKDIYTFINDYTIINNLKLAFPIGISINHVIAHDTYHENNLIILKNNDFITIDVGFHENGNIIDAARTFVYCGNENKSINDCELFVNKIEDFIKNELIKNKSVKIQKISKMTELYVSTGGYSGLDFLGGHNVELGKVHGSKLILNKPLTSLPNAVSKMIDKEETLSKNEMFCIEIYMAERFTQGQMIQSLNIPITHYELSENINDINSEELQLYELLKKETYGYAYYYTIHEKYNNKTIETMINKGYIIKHYPLEFKTNTGNIVKFIQHENTFIINENYELVNLTRKQI
jgi:methionine aminopeptidase